jgi:DNA-binding MarR family transcriptional regulator
MGEDRARAHSSLSNRPRSYYIGSGNASTHGGAIVSTIQGRAWRELLEGHRDLVRYLETTFRPDVPLQYYDVMLHVSESDGGLRMTDLAERIVLSKSGLTSLVDRMEGDGLVQRRPDPADRRATRIVLTPEGERRFAEVSERHRATVHRLFTSRVTADEARVIVDVMERVRRGVEEPAGAADAPS